MDLKKLYVFGIKSVILFIVAMLCVFLFSCSNEDGKTHGESDDTIIQNFGKSELSTLPPDTPTPSMMTPILPEQSIPTPDMNSTDSSTSTLTPGTTPSNTATPDSLIADLQFVSWEYFLDNDLHNAAYKGEWEMASVDFSNFDAAAECDIDGDGETELILRYVNSYLLGGNSGLLIEEYAYIILKNNAGQIAEVAGFWDEYTVYHNLRYGGQYLFVVTNYWMDAAGSRTEISVYSDGEFIEYSGYTEHADYADYGDAAVLNGQSGPVVAEIIEENGLEYIVLWGKKEKYLGFHGGIHYSTNDPSIDTYEDLKVLKNRIYSYPLLEFK